MAYLQSVKTYVIACVLMVVGMVSTYPTSAQDVRAQIEELNSNWVSAFKNRDFARIEALYMPDGLLLPSGMTAIEGQKAIVSVWRSWSELPNVEIAFAASRVVVSSSSDLAYDYGWYTFAFDADKGRSEDQGKYVTVWQRVNGSWNVAAHTFNSNLPAPVVKSYAPKPCVADNRTRVAANDECLVIGAFGEAAERTSLIVFIHGDGYRPDPADYGPSDYMYPIAQRHGTKGVVAIGLIRPGYFDSRNNFSTGNSYRAWDSFQLEVIETVAAGIKVLKDHYNADSVILAGHSGGAAISGVIIGKYPGLVDAAILGSCPCNVPDWRTLRRGYNNWPLSLSPHNFIGETDKFTKVVAVTGSNDDNTDPVLAREYVAVLKANGIDATYVEVPGVGHNDLVRAEEFTTIISQLLDALR